MRIRHKRRSGLMLWGLALVMVLSAACGRKAVDGQAAVPRITVEEVKARLEQGETITFIDSRSEGAWAGAVAKVPGAFRVPPNDIPDDLSNIPRGHPIVVYCT